MRTLARERDQFRAVLEGMHEAVIAVNTDNRVTMVNGSARQLFGFPKEPVGELLSEMNLAPELYAPLMPPRLRASTVSEFELQAIPPKTVLSRVTLWLVRGAVIVAYDVTEMRRLETMRRDFVANVSHELRTPVSVIRANAETLLDGALEEEKLRGFSFKQFSEILNGSNLIADLLDLSRIEAGHYEVLESRLNLHAIVHRVAESVKHKLETKEMVLEISVEEHLEALGDAQALEQVLINLVENGVKYTPKGGRLLLRAQAVSDRVRLKCMTMAQVSLPNIDHAFLSAFTGLTPVAQKRWVGPDLGWPL